ncbi:hypothetical protein EMIHUDRAFT_455973 [Emiliania huxleyi CCMP1516]|uniref:Uncharacterized protein n=2 Tax=Emiliania huxleyi TaxID=2903 RepID=A0A0D3KAN1_EMIH1|nr:hypothetical protein EMIHUDRAFT_455973 [Emiliania huxleyi CCMP1516]EOD32816.1 hypothetical protein EMIHUDRAFT_455973 [Emiliania huxleyi CCMP1516]|eukprot:XP_005785245.1 hypothetical protein EMIHUDRAFT_455973 [Emiliania huxleyi CCMP1516]
MFLALTATATLTAEQEEELVTLIDASASAVAHLPTTSRARDEIRLLHGKLTELQAAAATVTPEEWDIMLRALLRANHYGSAPPLRNTQPPPGVAALREALAAEGLQEQLPLAAAHDDERLKRSDDLGDLDNLETISREERLKRRPPPWERDCDCCFERCPAGNHAHWALHFECRHHCLRQSDGLLLACRGASLGEVVESLGEVVDAAWTASPLPCAAAAIGAGLAIGLWARAQLLPHRVRRRKRAAD